MFLITLVGMVFLTKNLKNASLSPLGNSKWPLNSKMAEKIGEISWFYLGGGGGGNCIKKDDIYLATILYIL